MRTIRGRLLRSMEEEIIVRRGRPQRRSGESEFIYPVGESPVKAAILPYRGDAELSDVVHVDYSYRCNFVPPRPEIRVDDEVVRFLDKPENLQKKLTVKQETTVEGVQSLILQDKVDTLV